MPFVVRHPHRLARLAGLLMLAGALGSPAAKAAPMPREATDFAARLKVEGSTLTVPAGSYTLATGPVQVNGDAHLSIEPADTLTITDEPLEIAAEAPASWDKGTPLRGLHAEDLNAQGALVAGSLQLRTTARGPLLAAGHDYLLSPEFGMVGLAPGSPLKPHQLVYASYRVGLLRLDALFVDAQGKVALVRGTPHISRPLPPAPPAPGAVRLANVFRPRHATALAVEDVFPILETSQTAQTRSIGRIPKTLARIHAKKPVRIVFLGDSVTEGANAGTIEQCFVERMRAFLFQKYCFPAVLDFPHASINVMNMSFGGTNSSQWLRVGPHRDYFTQHPEADGERINFDRVAEVKPDLVCVEFVNDAGFAPGDFEELYGTLLRRVRAAGAELILITPHYTAPAMMGIETLRDVDPRPYVAFLRAFAERNQLGLADASARWEHLWREGLPYTTLLGNTLNHPDGRGHALFAEELAKCFAE